MKKIKNLVNIKKYKRVRDKFIYIYQNIKNKKK